MNILEKLNIDLRFGNDKNNEFQLTNISFSNLNLIVSTEKLIKLSVTLSILQKKLMGI